MLTAAILLQLLLSTTSPGSARAEWMSPAQLAAWMGVPVRSVYAWIQAGTAPRSYKVGRHRRMRMADIESWLAERGDEAEAEPARLYDADVEDDGQQAQRKDASGPT